MAPAKSNKKKVKPTVKDGAVRPAVPAPPSEKRMAAVVCVGLVLACIAIYHQTLSHEFVNYDDDLYVTGNSQVQAGLNWDNVGWAFTTDRAMYMHPLTWMSHMLDCTLYGLHPWGHHLTNLVFHAAASVLLFLALRLLTGALWPSAAVAALFAVHPLHVESVAWVAERKDVLSAFFWMLALGAHGLYVRRGGALRYAAVAAAFVLGLMSKPMVVTLPFVLLLLDYWPLDRVNRADSFGVMAQKAGRLAAEKIPLFLIAALSCASTFVMQARGNNLSFGGKVPFAARCANAMVVYVLYLAKTVWPSGLAAFYPHPISRPLWQVAGAVLILAAVTLFCLRHIRRHPYLIVGWCWYLGTLVPVIELVQAGNFSHADRYTYIPLIGVFVMVAWGAGDLARSWHVPGRAVVIASAAALIALTVCAHFQAGHWRDTETLFSHAITVGQESGVAFGSRGKVALVQRRYDEAKTYLTKALDLEPENVKTLNNLGALAINRNHYDEAEPYVTKALDLQPDCDDALNNLVLIALKLRHHDTAKAYLTKALELNAGNIEALKNLGKLALDQGHLDEARTYLVKALELDPKCVSALNNLGGCFMEQGQYEEAQRHFRKALDADPRNIPALNNLGDALAKLGRQEEANGYLRKAAELERAPMVNK